LDGRATNREGSLYKRASDGRWIGAVLLGYDEEGHLRRKTVSGKTREETAKKLRALHHNIDEGLPPPDDKIMVGQLLDSWLADVVPLRVAPGTLANYSSLVKHHIKPAFGRKRLSRLLPDDVQRFITSKLNEGLSTRTVRHLRGVLVQALEHAVRQGRVARNVAVLTDGPRLKQRDGRTMTVDEAKKLLKVARGDRLEALYPLMLATGIPPGEAFGLPWTHVDLKSGQITVRQALSRQPGGNVIGDGKTGTKGWRTIKLPSPVVEALKSHLRRQRRERKEMGEAWQDHGLVFCTPIGTPLDPDNHRRAFTALTERAGIGRWHPHELRHSATSIMLAQGVPIDVVSKILGHTSIRITADVYGHILEPQKNAAAEAMAAALWDRQAKRGACRGVPGRKRGTETPDDRKATPSQPVGQVGA
jgi:integrase